MSHYLFRDYADLSIYIQRVYIIYKYISREYTIYRSFINICISGVYTIYRAFTIDLELIQYADLSLNHQIYTIYRSLSIYLEFIQYTEISLYT